MARTVKRPDSLVEKIKRVFEIGQEPREFKPDARDIEYYAMRCEAIAEEFKRLLRADRRDKKKGQSPVKGGRRRYDA